MFVEILPNARDSGFPRTRATSSIPRLGQHGGQRSRIHPGGQPLGRSLAITGHRFSGSRTELVSRRSQRRIIEVSIKVS
jgi:hypothetical protein